MAPTVVDSLLSVVLHFLAVTLFVVRILEPKRSSYSGAAARLCVDFLKHGRHTVDRKTMNMTLNLILVLT